VRHLRCGSAVTQILWSRTTHPQPPYSSLQVILFYPDGKRTDQLKEKGLKFAKEWHEEEARKAAQPQKAEPKVKKIPGQPWGVHPPPPPAEVCISDNKKLLQLCGGQQLASGPTSICPLLPRSD